MNQLTRCYYPLLGPGIITQQDALALHESRIGYRIAFFEGDEHRCTLLVKANLSVTLRLPDPTRRLRWVLVWSAGDVPGSSSANMLSTVGCFCYFASNFSKECDFKSTMFASARGTRSIHFFDMATARLVMENFNDVPVHTLPYPEFGEYSPYLEFDYSGLEALVQDWPESFLLANRPPERNIEIAGRLGRGL